MNNSFPSMANLKPNDTGKASINHGDMSLFPDSGVNVIPNSWFHTSPEGDNVNEIFNVLSDVQLPTRVNTSMESIVEFLCEPEEGRQKRKADESHGIGGVSRESKGKQECAQHKRVRSAEAHNKSERMRRDRIKAKMRALQELIPNCNKTDRASMLDDAIEYIKALKLQAHMMSMGGSFISPTSFQTMQVPNFTPVLQMIPGLGFGMGADGTCYNPNFPMMSIPSASLHPSPSASSGDPFQVPFFTSPTFSVMQPMITTPALCHPKQGESASSSIPSTATDLQQVPIISQSCISHGLPSPVSHKTTHTSLSEK